MLTATAINPVTGWKDVTRSDNLNQYDYSTFTSSFESDGDLRQTNAHYDDGAIAITNYDSNGVITDSFIDATAASRAYQSLKQVYSGGLLTTSTLIGNDGVQTNKTYDTTGGSSVLTEQVRTDLANAYAWSSITEAFNSSGTVLKSTTIYDTGNATRSVVSTYNAAGVITDKLTTFADNSTREVVYTRGVVEYTREVAVGGNESVYGGSGNNVIWGNSGNDLLRGNGGNDVFLFSGHGGADTIADFTDGSDRLDLTAYGIDNLAALKTKTTVSQQGANTVIDLGKFGKVTLANFSMANLDDSDFAGTHKVVNYADGGVATFYTNVLGEQAHVSIDATKAVRTYQSYEGYNQAGLLTDSLLVLNDSAVADRTFDVSSGTSLLTHETRMDPGNAYDWAKIDTDYNAAGNPIKQVTVYDAGNIIESTVSLFDSAGILADQLTTNNDGSSTEKVYSGGVVDYVRNIAVDGTQTLFGGTGDNTLFGGTGNDLLKGGTGNDVFQFSGSFGADKISDFGTGADKLDLTAFGIHSRDDLDAAHIVA